MGIMKSIELSDEGFEISKGGETDDSKANYLILLFGWDFLLKVEALL